MNNSIAKRIIALIISVLMLTSLFSCKKESDYNLEYEQKLSELRSEKNKMLNEIYHLRNGMEEEIGNNSYMSFIFLGADVGIFEDVLPIFEEGDNEFTGVICFYEGEFPGMEGNISIQQYVELVNRGWDTALYWRGPGEDDADTATHLSAFLEGMKNEFSEFVSNVQTVYPTWEMDFPRSLVFGEGIYSIELDTILDEHGIQNALHDGTGELELVSRDKPDGLWKSAAKGWRDLSYSVKLKGHIESKGGYASFRIGFENGEDDYNTSFYPINGESLINGDRLTVFKRMIESFKKSVKKGSVHIVGISEAREKLIKYCDDKDNYETYSTNRIAELNKMISDIEYRMVKLYEEYFG